MSNPIPLALFTILLTTPSHLPQSHAFDVIGTTSGIVGLIQFIEDVGKRLLAGPENKGEILATLERMNEELKYDVGEISKALRDLPNIIDLINKRNKLQDNIDEIGFVHKSAIDMMKDIKDGRPQDNDTYLNFRTQHEEQINFNIHNIYNMLLEDATTNFLTNNFSTNLQLYENVCKTGMSHRQLLDGLLGKIKTATAQYFVTKNLIWDFVEPITQDPLIPNNRINLDKSVRAKYKNAVVRLKEMMSEASREVWKCDAEDSAEDPDRYVHLRCFQRYFTNENDVDGGIECSKECSEITQIEKCDIFEEFCRMGRRCPNSLVNCDKFGSRSDVSWACLNKNKSATARYSSIRPQSGESDFFCDDGYKYLVRSIKHEIPLGGVYFCDYCQCICPEEQYYLSLDKSTIDFDDTDKVITGARFVVQNNVVHIQIQQGDLLPHGYVNRSSAVWKPVPEYTSNVLKITWNEYREFNLAEILLPKDWFVAGLSFGKSDDKKNRINLVTYGCRFLIDIGKTLCPYEENMNVFIPEDTENELDLSELDVPTKSYKQNTPDSKTDQFLRFTTSSLKKDGGQTTLPYIDTAPVYTEPSMPLSGVALIHRGQPEYGGFLALKLFTYDLTPYIKDDINLDTE